MGWTKVCGTAQSGIWVLKGNAEDEAGYIQDCLGNARARLSVFKQAWTWSSSQTTN